MIVLGVALVAAACALVYAATRTGILGNADRPVLRGGSRRSGSASGGGVLLVSDIAAVALAVAALTWWWVGDLSSSVARPPDRDYLAGPYSVSPRAEWAVGLVAVALGVAGARNVLLRTRRDLVPAGRWLRAAFPALIAAFVAAAGWRTVTAGGDGANIGGGVVLLIAPVLLSVLLGVSAREIALAINAQRKRRAHLVAAGVGAAILAVLTAFVSAAT